MYKAIFTILIFFLPGIVFAASSNTSFSLTATVNAATGINIVTSSLTSGAQGDVLTPTGSSLSFGNLIYTTFTDPVTKVISNAWLPNNTFAIDISPGGGSANGTDLTVQYAELANPNNVVNGHGLGWKSTITFVVINDAVETPIVAHGGTGKMLLKDIPALGETITAAQIGKGILRMYVGMVTKNPGDEIKDPDDGELFTNLDLPGEYTGKLVISATIF